MAKMMIQLLCPNRQEDLLIGPFKEVEVLHDAKYVVADGITILVRNKDLWRYVHSNETYFGIRMFTID